MLVSQFEVVGKGDEKENAVGRVAYCLPCPYTIGSILLPEQGSRANDNHLLVISDFGLAIDHNVAEVGGIPWLIDSLVDSILFDGSLFVCDQL